MNKQTVLYLLAIVIIGIVTRFLFLDSVPANLHPDSVDTIRSYLEHRYQNNFSFFSTNWNGSHILNQLLIGLPWEILGRPYWAVRFSPAVMSIICSILFFLLIKKMVSHSTVAFMSTLLLMVDPWFMNFSRSGWENIFNCVGVIILLYATLLPQKKTTLQIGLLIVVTIISPYLYHPGKIIAVISVAVLLITTFLRNISLKNKVGTSVVSLLIIGLGITPLFFIPSMNQFGRIEVVSIFSVQEPWLALQLNIANNWLGFLTFQPEQWFIGLNSRYLPLDGWIIHPVIMVLFMAGTLSTLKKRWWLVFLGFLLVFPVNLLSRNTPDAARTIHALPFIYLMVANGMSLLLSIWKKNNGKHRFNAHMLRTVLSGVIFIGFAGVVVTQLNHYWKWINDPKTLTVREPAIYASEYTQWLVDIDDQLQSLGRTLSIYEWRDLTSPTTAN